MIILLAIAVIAVSAPIAGMVLVSLASRREDAAFSLSGKPTGTLESFGRRMVGFHGDGVCRQPVRRTGTTSRSPGRDIVGAFAASASYTTDSYTGDDYQLPSALTGDYLTPPVLANDLADVPHLVG